MMRRSLTVLIPLMLTASVLAQDPGAKAAPAEAKLSKLQSDVDALRARTKALAHEASAKVQAIGRQQDPVPTEQDPKAKGSDADAADAQDALGTDALMKGINRNFRMVNRFLRKPSGDAPMAEVRGMQVLALRAKMSTPGLVATLPEDERPAFLKAYRKDMNVFVRGLLDLEDAMVDENWEQAGEIVKSLNAGKKAGHNAYKGKDEDGGGDRRRRGR